MEYKKITNEHPVNAWPEKFINVKNRVVLDLGCGFFGMTPRFSEGTMEWDNIKLPDMISTSEYFLSLDSKFVIGVDNNNDDLICLSNKFKDRENIIFLNQSLNTPREIEDLIFKYNVEVIKADIEGAESNISAISDDVFTIIKEYYIETHNEGIHNQFMGKFKQHGYEIRNIIRVGEQYPLVIFAYKK